MELYSQVKDDIPDHIGVYVVSENKTVWCYKKPKRQEPKCTHEDLMFSLMQGLSREYEKYRKLLDKSTKK